MMIEPHRLQMARDGPTGSVGGCAAYVATRRRARGGTPNLEATAMESSRITTVGSVVVEKADRCPVESGVAGP
jgi:hypothetical protein